MGGDRAAPKASVNPRSSTRSSCGGGNKRGTSMSSWALKTLAAREPTRPGKKPDPETGHAPDGSRGDGGP